MPKQRIEYLDALRGLTIILVVYSHIVVLLMHTRSVTNDFFILLRMPLFFFVSGFLSYAVYDRALIKKRLKNRLLKQLLPTAVVFLIFVGLFHIDLKEALLKSDKMGYWFTPVVVEYFCTYMIMVVLFNKLRASVNVRAIALLVIMLAAIWIAPQIDPHKFNRPDWVRLLCLYHYCYYFPFFFLGTLVRMKFDLVTRLLSNGYVAGLLILAFAGAYYWPHPVVVFVQRTVGVLVVYRIFQYYGHTFSGATRIGRVLSYTGRYTLEIYLLHYIIIRSMGALPKAMDWTAIDASWIVQFAVYFLFAVVVTAICLMIAKVVNIAPPLYKLMFGMLKHTPEKKEPA